MPRKPASLSLRLSLAVVALGLLTAFTYPLVREGYERVGSRVYDRAQVEILEQSMKSYLGFNRTPGWTAETTTRQILSDLDRGWDRGLNGRLESFLPPGSSVESLAHNYRIVYKGPESFKVVARR